MPGRETHAYVGLASGIGYAAFQAKEQNSLGLVAEIAGGALGGYWGGLLPDVFEPAIHSWHRGVAHSGAAGTTVAVVARCNLVSWHDHCREQAELCCTKRKSLEMMPHPAQPNLFIAAPADQWQHLLLTVQELLWAFAAGFANGLAAGYVSHLALDATTPRSIPLLGL